MIFRTPILSAQYLEVIGRIDQLKVQLSYALQQQPGRWTGLLRRSTLARAIQASNSIEGYNVTIDEAIAAVDMEDAPEERTHAWTAVTHYRDAMSYIMQLADDPFYVHNEGTIRSLHYMMLSYDLTKHPGRWRPGPIYVRREPENTIVHEGPEVEMVPGLMEELIDDLNSKDPCPSIIKAAMAHLNLVMIHPFSDGNGRMARAIQTMVLARDGTIDRNFSSIEEYLGRNTQAYYEVLAGVGEGQWHPDHDASPWIKFCLVAHFRQAETLQRRLREAGRLWEEIEIEIERRKLNERVIPSLFNAAMGFRIRNQSYRNHAGISDQAASRDLAALTSEGLLIPHGEKRGRSYIAGPWLREVRAKTRENKIITDPFSDTKITVPKEARAEQNYLPGLKL